MSEKMYRPEDTADSSTTRQQDVGDARFTGSATYESDHQFVEALRSGNEHAFLLLINEHHQSMLRLAVIYVANQAVAEEVVQETWLAVCQGLSRFEGRSSLKTWIFRILMNRARTRGQREGRSVPFSSLEHDDAESFEPAVDPAEFFPPDHPDAGGWKVPPQNWEANPEDTLLMQEMYAHIHQAIAKLPTHQREVITLRDVEGWTAEEVCTSLGISAINQRVLLHRARSRVRNVLENYFQEKK